MRSHASPTGGQTRRIVQRLQSRALGGIAAQVSQAIGSFALSFVAARYLGLTGLGVFAVLNAVITLGTAVTSGFVGDSLTVLDRHDRALRAGLQWWLFILSVTAALVSCAVAGGIGFLSWRENLAFGVAMVAYLVEDSVRRMLMATLNFWRIVALDLLAMVASIIVLVPSFARGSVDLTMLLVALAAGQIVGGLAGWLLFPRAERYLVAMRRPARAKVAAYGTWRALQQAVRAATLALVRVICLLVVADAAVGALEAARIYMAPAVLAVTGVSSYLFASYASSPRAPLAQLLAFADRTMIRLTVFVLLGGLIGVLAMPLLASLLTGGEYDLSRLAVAGWALVAAATAGVTPYGQLASVRGRHVAVFWLRVADSVASLITIYVVVSATGDVAWAPLVMAAWSFAGGLAIRLLVIGPDVRSERMLSIHPIPS